jgi:hypothetical protein
MGTVFLVAGKKVMLVQVMFVSRINTYRDSRIKEGTDP